MPFCPVFLVLRPNPPVLVSDRVGEWRANDGGVRWCPKGPRSPCSHHLMILLSGQVPVWFFGISERLSHALAAGYPSDRFDTLAAATNAKLKEKRNRRTRSLPAILYKTDIASASSTLWFRAMRHHQRLSYRWMNRQFIISIKTIRADFVKPSNFLWYVYWGEFGNSDMRRWTVVNYWWSPWMFRNRTKPLDHICDVKVVITVTSFFFRVVPWNNFE